MKGAALSAPSPDAFNFSISATMSGSAESFAALSAFASALDSGAVPSAMPSAEAAVVVVEREEERRIRPPKRPVGLVWLREAMVVA